MVVAAAICSTAAPGAWGSARTAIRSAASPVRAATAALRSRTKAAVHSSSTPRMWLR